MNRDHSIAAGRTAARPASGFIAQLVKFLLNPTIRNGRDEAAPLQYAAWNLIASVSLVALLTTGLAALLQTLAVGELSGGVRPGLLSLLLAAQALIFALLFWLLTAGACSLQKRGLHLLSFMQVLQSWALLNPLMVLLCWAVLERLLASDERPLSLVYLALGGVYALALLVLTVRLLLLPVIHYLSRFYSVLIAAPLVLLIACGSFFLSAQLVRPFSAVAFDAQATCQALNHSRNTPGSAEQLPEKRVIDGCLAQFR